MDVIDDLVKKINALGVPKTVIIEVGEATNVDKGHLKKTLSEKTGAIVKIRGTRVLVFCQTCHYHGHSKKGKIGECPKCNKSAQIQQGNDVRIIYAA